MEILRWTAESLKSQFSEGSNLESIVLEIEAGLQKQQKVICSVSVNGIRLSEGEEKRYGSSEMGEIETLEVEVSQISGLLEETRQSTVAYCFSLAELALKTAELLRSDDQFAAHRGFKGLIDGLESLLIAQGLMMDVGQIPQGLPSTPIADFEGIFARLLGQLLEGYEKRDFILVADLLEYDLTGTLTGCAGALNEVRFAPDKENSPSMAGR